MLSILCLICFCLPYAHSLKNERTKYDFFGKENMALQSFVFLSMQNYTNWLVSHDPSAALTEPVILKTDKRVDYGVDATFNVSLQRISGYSKTSRTIVGTVTDLDKGGFVVGRVAPTVEKYIFKANYITMGTVNVNNFDIPFSGDGSWEMETNETNEGAELRFTLAEDEYINLQGNLTKCNVLVKWSTINLKGLNISDNDTRENAIKRIELGVGEVYHRYLNNSDMQTINPVKELLTEYFTEVFSEITLSEIIARAESARTTPPSDGSTGSSILMNCIKILILLQLIFVLLL